MLRERGAVINTIAILSHSVLLGVFLVTHHRACRASRLCCPLARSLPSFEFVFSSLSAQKHILINTVIVLLLLCFVSYALLPLAIHLSFCVNRHPFPASLSPFRSCHSPWQHLGDNIQMWVHCFLKSRRCAPSSRRSVSIHDWIKTDSSLLLQKRELIVSSTRMMHSRLSGYWFSSRLSHPAPPGRNCKHSPLKRHRLHDHRVA